MTEIEFYTNPMSRGRIVRWMLEELGEPYHTTILPYGAPMKEPGYKAINPMGKVPAIVHGGAVVTECAAICAYLADAFPQKRLAPPADRRADYYRWMFFAAGPLEQAIVNRSLGVVVPPEREGMIGYGSFKRVMDTLEYAVGRHAYVTGDTFTAADVYVGSHISWGMQFKTIEHRQVFADYLARLDNRPAFLRAREIDDEAAAELQKAAQA